MRDIISDVSHAACMSMLENSNVAFAHNIFEAPGDRGCVQKCAAASSYTHRHFRHLHSGARALAAGCYFFARVAAALCMQKRAARCAA